MTRIKLAIVDDNESFRNAIVRLMRLEPDFDVIIEAGNGVDLLERLQSLYPDIIIIDISMPLVEGVDVTTKIRETYPHLKLIAYSRYDMEENVIKLIIHGMKSFVGKEDEPEELFLAIRVVQSGNVYMTNRVAQIIQKNLRTSFKEKCPYELTDIERILLNGINNGLSSTQLGDMVCKSPRTVEKYIADMYKRFRVTNKVELIKLISTWEMEDVSK